MTLPNFIMPGAPKSGTTSLHIYLREHPEVVMSAPKEPYFFCGKITNEALEKYNDCFSYNGKKKNSVKMIGESSSVYLCSPKAPIRIKKLLGKNVKFIFLLRNPTERTISAYLHMYKRDAEKRTPYQALVFNSKNKEKVILEETKQIDEAINNKKIIVNKSWKVPDEPLQHFHYVRNSFYSIHLKEYFDFFPRKNFLFLFTEDLKNEPIKTFKRVETFLGIDTSFIPTGIGVIHNKTYVPNNNLFSKLVSNFVSTVAKYINTDIKFIRKIYGFMAGSNKFDIDHKTRNYLNSLFQQEKESLSKLIGEDVSSVWN